MFRETIPGGVNSGWPMSHSRNATREYLPVSQSAHYSTQGHQNAQFKKTIEERLGKHAFAAVLRAFNEVNTGHIGIRKFAAFDKHDRIESLRPRRWEDERVKFFSRIRNLSDIVTRIKSKS